MRNAFKYLSQYCSAIPKNVDRLIISAFLEINKIVSLQNKFIKEYIIIKDDTEEYNKLVEFISIIRSEQDQFGFEELIELFEFVISPADRIVNGAIYTPSNIREYIVKETVGKKNQIHDLFKVSDIACGCGGFLLNASIELKRITKNSYADIFKNHIYGIDIQEYSINRSKLLLSLLALNAGEDQVFFEFNLFQGDSLDFDWHSKIELFEGFDVIIGNPPYVCARNLELDVKEKIKKWAVCKSGNTDLYIPFFQIAIENLAINGILGFITMNTFFKSLNGRALRDYFQRKSLDFRIIDFGSEQIFKSKSTYTCICFIENRRQNFISYISTESIKLNSRHSFKKIHYIDLNSKKGWNLRDYKTITKIESTGIPFGELYQTRHGIATLKNDVFIFKPVSEDDNFYYLQNGSLNRIEKGICRDIVNSNKLSRETSLSSLKEKVIFPYDNQEKPKLLQEELIQNNFPEAYRYLEKNRQILSKRDKGTGKYENWYAFGRTQSLEKVENKMFFPKYSDRSPNFIINSDDSLLFYNGLAIIGSSQEDMQILKKIMSSSVFWYYIKTTSKPYSSNYYSLNGNYIRNFGVCELCDLEKEFVLRENDNKILDEFFESKYEVLVK